jgi:uncharacterized repeat protein (TIGR01451 family)
VVPSVTFVYHDLEGVLPDGITMHVAGSFNDWSTTANPMSYDVETGLFSTLIVLDEALPATVTYKYVAGSDWGSGKGTILNTDDRQVVITGTARIDDTRNISAGWYVLTGPESIEISLGQATPPISGEAWFTDIPFGENQVLSAEIGYGTSPDLDEWIWSEAAFSERNGNNDVFTAALTPEAGGVYSYTIRFNGNWGAGNPNSTWYTAELFGGSTSYGQLVVLTPELAITKEVETPAEILPGSLVTYTIILDNSGAGAALNVELSDDLPEGVTFDEFIASGGAAHQDGLISWSGDLPGGQELTIIFRALVGLDPALFGETITNTAEYVSSNSGSGSAQAAFTIAESPVLLVSFTSNSPVVLGQPAIFTNATEGYGPISYSWDFGDDTPIATDPNPTHIYAAAGVYTVTLTAENPFETGSYTGSFRVLQPASITILKEVAEVNQEVEAGELVTYTVTLVNHGEVDAVGLRVIDELPQGLQGDDLDYTTTLPAGETLVLTVTGVVMEGLEAGTVITNTAAYTYGTSTGSSSVSITLRAGEVHHQLFLPVIPLQWIR